ncbi:cell division protein FtsQ/DivIB [Peribacillus loiseleuriae]|uniref:cell division protein FtsQ/DivIB n=1 Tax=Peribacillus loiseleuriae TaxID=1679170 RepID=UPI00381ACA0F
MEKGKIVSIEDRIPKLKKLRKRKANRRLILLLSFFFILIACVLYFLSPLSHIKEIKVMGNQYLSSDQIITLSGLTNDTNIWKVNKSEMIKKMIESQKEIESVTISTQFPNSVLITVTEFERIAYLSKNNRFYPIMENGKILTELESGEIPVFAPVLIDFTEGDTLKQLLDELKVLPEEIRNSISEIRKEPTKTDAYHITMFMNDGFEVSATSRTLSKKMIHYPSIVAQLDPNVKGVINLEVGSFFKAYDTPNLTEEINGVDQDENH